MLVSLCIFQIINPNFIQEGELRTAVLQLWFTLVPRHALHLPAFAAKAALCCSVPRQSRLPAGCSAQTAWGHRPGWTPQTCPLKTSSTCQNIELEDGGSSSPPSLSCRQLVFSGGQFQLHNPRTPSCLGPRSYSSSYHVFSSLVWLQTFLPED